jgi:hypothetical protein
VIDIQALRELVDKGQQPVVIDVDGNVLYQSESGEIGPAILIAVPVTDAVKVVAGGLVLGSLDRDTLWSVEGFQLGRQVLSALDDGATTSQDLIDAVVEAGFAWQVISRDTGVL